MLLTAQGVVHCFSVGMSITIRHQNVDMELPPKCRCGNSHKPLGPLHSYAVVCDSSQSDQ